MSVEVATLVILSVAGAGFVVWIVSVLRALRMISGTAMPGSTTIAEATIDDEQEDLARRIAREVSSGSSLSMIPVRVEVKEPSSVRFWTPAGASVLPLTSGIEGEFSLARVGDGKVTVRLRSNGAAEQRAAKISLYICLLVGLPLLIGLTLALLAWVAPSPIPEARWQAIQVIHVGHVLWPPFLIMWMGRRNQRIIETSLGQVLDRLKFGG